MSSHADFGIEEKGERVESLPMTATLADMPLGSPACAARDKASISTVRNLESAARMSSIRGRFYLASRHRVASAPLKTDVGVAAAVATEHRVRRQSVSIQDNARAYDTSSAACAPRLIDFNGSAIFGRGHALQAFTANHQGDKATAGGFLEGGADGFFNLITTRFLM